MIMTRAVSTTMNMIMITTLTTTMMMTTIMIMCTAMNCDYDKGYGDGYDYDYDDTCVGIVSWVSMIMVLSTRAGVANVRYKRDASSLGDFIASHADDCVCWRRRRGSNCISVSDLHLSSAA